MMESFKDCCALITGASAGLGEEFARQLAPQAGTLILVARRLDKLEALKAELEAGQQFLSVRVYGCDLADEHAVDGLITWLHAEGFPIDFLVNNAGVGDHGAFESSDWPRVRGMMAVNIAALTRLTHAMLPTLKRSSGAAILNVSSVASLLPLPGMAVYAATKAYVTSFSEALRLELRDSGVTVTALCPGPVNTEFGDVASRGPQDSMQSPELFKVTPAEVVRESLRAVAGDRPRVIPGWIVCLVMTAVSALPMLLLRRLLRARPV